MLQQPSVRLGLGTVQFGQDYGITNRRGCVPEQETRAIISFARQIGVEVLDTAMLYGRSEAVLGRIIGNDSRWRVVTKTRTYRDLADAAAMLDRFNRDLAQSLAALSTSSLYGLLTHNADDLLGPHGHALWDGLRKQRSAGVVKKIGASVYSGAQIEGLLKAFDLDLIQLPLNAVDQRLVGCGLLSELNRRGIEIHARSVFLQGLLLADPGSIDPRFGILPQAVSSLHAAWQGKGLTPLEGALGAVLQRPEIDYVIVGVTSVAELRQIAAAQQKASLFARRSVIDLWEIDDENVVNPALWGRL